jgi:hypothetical protein
MADGKSNGHRIAPGVRLENGRPRGYVRDRSGVLHAKRFPAGTDLSVISRWRSSNRTAPPSKGEWCYLYIVEGGRGFKIGRTTNPTKRLKGLQVGSDHPLKLVATAPIHATLETLIHERFAHLRIGGEWFEPNAELRAFIADIQAGANPLRWVWDDLKPVVARR